MLHWFALRLEPHTLVAAEIPDRTAALLLDQGQPTLLGTFADLAQLAQRLRRPLVTISYGSRPTESKKRTKDVRLAAVA